MIAIFLAAYSIPVTFGSVVHVIGVELGRERHLGDTWGCRRDPGR